MNTEQHINRFDELIREKLDNYEMEPDMDLLANIHARKNRFLNSRNLLTLMILLVILTAGIVGGYFYSGTRLKQQEQQSSDSASGYDKNNGKGLLKGYGAGYYAYRTATETNGRQQNDAFTTPSLMVAQNTTTGAIKPNNTNNASLFTKNTPNVSRTNYTFNHSPVKANVTDAAAKQTAEAKNSTVTDKAAKDNKTTKDGTNEPGKKQDPTTCSVTFEYYTSYDASFHFMANTSSPSAQVTLKWNFGDGESSTEANPKHTYSKPGQYAATLTALNTVTNCKAEVYRLIRVTKGVELSSSTIKGTVFADAEYAGKTLVQLIEHNSKKNTFEVIQTALTNSKGQYEFSDITAGTYIVKSAAYKNYSSTFYGNTTEIDYATNVTVFTDDYKVLSGYDIQLLNNRALPGNPLVKSDLPGDAGSRVMIIVDENNQPLTTVVVSRNGVINTPVNLPSGDYKLMDPETGKVAGGITVDDGGVASAKPGSGEAGPGMEKNLALAPNPASDYVRVSLNNATSSPVQIRIINSSGSVVQEFTLPGGTNINTININHLPGGMYTIAAIQDGEMTSSILVKAMDNSK